MQEVQFNQKYNGIFHKENSLRNNDFPKKMDLEKKRIWKKNCRDVIKRFSQKVSVSCVWKI